MYFVANYKGCLYCLYIFLRIFVDVCYSCSITITKKSQHKLQIFRQSWDALISIKPCLTTITKQDSYHLTQLLPIKLQMCVLKTSLHLTRGSTSIFYNANAAGRHTYFTLTPQHLLPSSCCLHPNALQPPRTHHFPILSHQLPQNLFVFPQNTPNTTNTTIRRTATNSCNTQFSNTFSVFWTPRIHKKHAYIPSVF